MFFIASKLFWIVFRPLNFIFFLACSGLFARHMGWRRTGAVKLALAFLLFVAAGFTQATDYLLLRLETAVPAGVFPTDTAGIVVLGGGIDSITAAPGANFNLSEAGDRLIHALALRQRFPAARLIFSGGDGSLTGGGAPETAGAAAVVRALYGNDQGIELEDQSRTTAENAQAVAALLGPARDQPYLLVTSAFHMPRAILSFRKAGVNVIAAPTDFRARPLAFPYLSAETPMQFLKASLLVKEYVGLLAYYVSGRTLAIWP